MGYDAWFDMQDMVVERLDGTKFVKKDVLFFHLRKDSTADKNAVPFEFDGLAEESHLIAYKTQLDQFLGQNKLLSGVRQVIHAEPSPVVEAAVVKVLEDEKESDSKSGFFKVKKKGA